MSDNESTLVLSDEELNEVKKFIKTTSIKIGEQINGVIADSIAELPASPITNNIVFNALSVCLQILVENNHSITASDVERMVTSLDAALHMALQKRCN